MSKIQKLREELERLDRKLEWHKKHEEHQPLPHSAHYKTPLDRLREEVEELRRAQKGLRLEYDSFVGKTIERFGAVVEYLKIEFVREKGTVVKAHYRKKEKK